MTEKTYKTFCGLAVEIVYGDMIMGKVLFKIIYIFFMMIVLFCIPTAPTVSAKKITVDSVGYYDVMDELDTDLSVAKERAKLDAMRNAVEKVGVYVESYTKTENLVVTVDEARVVAGKIICIEKSTVEQVIKDGGASYQCHLTATVDTDNVNIKEILNNKKLIESNIVQRRKIENLEKEIKILKNKYISAAKTKEDKQKIKNAAIQNDNELKNALVQASDYTVNEFYSLIKAHNNHGSSFPIDDMKMVDLGGGQFGTYMFFAGGTNANECTVAVLYSNKFGFVSKITLTALMNSPKAKLSAYQMEYIILKVLGIEENRARDFLNSLLSKDVPCGLAIWNEWANRNIAVTHEQDNGQLVYIRITAYNKLFNSEVY